VPGGWGASVDVPLDLLGSSFSCSNLSLNDQVAHQLWTQMAAKRITDQEARSGDEFSKACRREQKRPSGPPS